MSIKKSIKTVEKKRTRALETLCQITHMLRGSFGSSSRKCGKPNCWCADGDGHPFYRITFTHGGMSKTQVIHTEHVARIKPLCENYKRFRRARKMIRQYHDELNRLLELLEKDIIQRTEQSNEK